MAKPEKIYRVAAVEGRLCQHPNSIGTGQIHFVGHSKGISENPEDVRFPMGQPVAGLTFTPNGETELVRETGDGYVARKIRDGDWDYVETVESFDAPDGSGTKEKWLVALTEKNRAVRLASVPALEVPTPKEEAPKGDLTKKAKAPSPPSSSPPKGF